jgi:mannosyltransferase
MIELFHTATWRRVQRILPQVTLFGIILLAAVLRFHLLGYQSLWNDEGNSLRLAQRSIPDLIEAARLDIHPPGYYLTLKMWRALTGESEFGLRALSAFAGVLTVACVYGLGRALFARGSGLLAALLVAVNAFSVYYGQEARMYALLALVASSSMLVFVRWLTHPSWRLGTALAVLNAAGLYTQYAYPAVMVTQGICFVLWWLDRRDIRRLMAFVVLNVLTIALFTPQLDVALAQVTAWPRTGQPVTPGEGIATVARWLIYGNTVNITAWWNYGWPAIFMIAALLPDWIRRPGHYPPSWWRRLMPWVWLLISVAPFFALGLFREANLKFLLPAQIAVALLIGRGVWLLWELGSPNLFIVVEALPRLAAGFGLFWMLGISVEALTNLYENARYARPDYRAMARMIAANPRPGDAIILDAPNQQEVFTYYYHGIAPVYPIPVGLGGDDAATAASVNTVIQEHRRIFVLYWGESERDPNRIVEKTLAADAFEASSAWYGDVRLVQYATLPQSQAQPAAARLPARFGDAIILKSATLSSNTLQPGDVLGVSLNWTTDQVLSARYKVFVQLLDAQGQLVAQHDGEPGNNLAITTTWQPGQSISDAHGLLIPVNLPPGDYTLITGLYDLNNPQDRLFVNSTDALKLGTIQVR